MGRSVRLPSLVLVGALGLSGSGTALARELKPAAIRGRSVTPVRTGIVDMDRAAEWDRILGPPFRDEITPRARRPPRRLPEMPMPKGWERPPALDWAPAAAPAFDMPLAPLPSGNFAGLGDNNTAIPPDTHGAVGPTKVMTTLNTQVQVQTRAGALFSGPVTLGSFWGGIATSSVFDPRVYFDPDPLTGAGGSGPPSRAPNPPSSGLLVAVSDDDEPTRGARCSLRRRRRQHRLGGLPHRRLQPELGRRAGQHVRHGAHLPVRSARRSTSSSKADLYAGTVSPRSCSA